MSLWEWLSLASLCVAGAASPGPSLAVVVSASLAGGRPAGLAAAWAHALGVGLYATLTVLGLSVVITAQQWLFTGIQVVGALYLLWLAAGLWRSATAQQQAESQTTTNIGSSSRDAFAIAFLNPKLAVFMLALFSQFIRLNADAVVQLIMIATVTLVDGLWYSLITLVFTRGRWIDRLRNNAAKIDRVFAILLASVAVIILLRALRALA
jgi:threonine/homoserine/homoserine lactone efflux protein